MKKITYPDCSEDYLIWRPGSGERTIELYEISVCNEHRRTGRGTWLVNRMLEEIPKNTATVFAITRLSNKRAQEFYEALGFHRLGKLAHLYYEVDTRETAVVYGMFREHTKGFRR